MKQYVVTFITKKGGEENHEMITMACNAKEAVSNIKEIWYSENTMHAFHMHAKPVKEPEYSEDVEPVSETAPAYESETQDTTPEISAPAEDPEQPTSETEPEHSDDEPETEEAIPEMPAPAEEPEQPDDVPDTASAEMSSYPLDVPFYMRIKSLCKKCKHLESCFKKDRSNVLEDIHRSEPCDDVCGLCCSLCCQQFESHISKEELLSLLDDDDMPF